MDLQDIDTIALRLINPHDEPIPISKSILEPGENDLPVRVVQQNRNLRQAKAQNLEVVGLVVDGTLIGEEPSEEEVEEVDLFGDESTSLDEVDFQSLDGVGEATVEDINDYLTAHGLETVEDLEDHGLTELPGIGDALVGPLRKELE